MESLEYLFKPTTYLELFLRTDFEGTKEKLKNVNDRQVEIAIKREEAYRALKKKMPS